MISKDLWDLVNRNNGVMCEKRVKFKYGCDGKLRSVRSSKQEQFCDITERV